MRGTGGSGKREAGKVELMPGAACAACPFSSESLATAYASRISGATFWGETVETPETGA
jgi:hypothetical protein